MASTLIVVEGAHDASFFGYLIQGLGYQKARTLDQLPEWWRRLIPRTYPVTAKGTLDRVIRIPDVYTDSRGNDLGIVNAGGDTGVAGNLQETLKLLDVARFVAIGLAIDADHQITARQRFDDLITQLTAMNDEGQREHATGFPIPLPDQPGVIAPGPPRLGIFILPDNARAGTLETVLLEAAARDHPVIHRGARILVNYLATRPLIPTGLTGNPGRHAKAMAGTVANVLVPGASLAVALHTGGWFGDGATDVPAMKTAQAFLRELVPP